MKYWLTQLRECIKCQPCSADTDNEIKFSEAGRSSDASFIFSE